MYIYIATIGSKVTPIEKAIEKEGEELVWIWKVAEAKLAYVPRKDLFDFEQKNSLERSLFRQLTEKYGGPQKEHILRKSEVFNEVFSPNIYIYIYIVIQKMETDIWGV